MHARSTLLLALVASACAGQAPVASQAPAVRNPHASQAFAVAAPPQAPSEAAPEPAPDTLLLWAQAHLPRGGKAERNSDGALVVTHDVGPKDTGYTIAKAYLPLTETYLAAELGKTLGNPKPGTTITIPNLVTKVPNPDTDRLPWPDDKSMRGIFLTGPDATVRWEDTLRHMQERGMNAVILDGKAYMGEVTYPSKVKVAIDTGATKGAPIADMSRTIRFAHKYGVRVSVRVACFHDPLAAEKAPDLSVRGSWGGPYPIGWLDPAGDLSQQYIEDLVKEVIDLGADEINLDYVRYPVQNGLGNAEFHLKDHNRNQKDVITAFAHRIHAITLAKHVPLSLDIFGVTTQDYQPDIDNLGQEIERLGSEAEALMPMVYPSHYGHGYMGWAEPGSHPEIVGIGTRQATAKLARAHITTAVIRPWLQAFMWNSPGYGPKYLAQETVEATNAGGTGWIMWNPGGSYSDAWAAIPALPKK